MSTDDINKNIAKAYAEMYNKPEAQEIVEVDINEDNTNDVSDDGDGMDKVQPKALKKKFKDRKDKDLDNDGDEDESDEYLHNRRKTVKKAVDKKDDDGVLEYSKEKHTKKEGIIDRMLAGRNKEGSKKWVTKKPATKESVEPGFLMKRIQEKATANNVSKDDTRDSFDKQLAGRRIDDVAPASSGMTEAEFVKMHSPENANTPEFADAPVVFAKTLQAVKDSVKSKSPIRHNDSTIGESVEESMEKGMPPGEHVFDKKVDGKEIMVHKLDKSGKFCAYVDGKKIGEYDDLKSAKSAAMDSMKEDADLDEAIEKEGNMFTKALMAARKNGDKKFIVGTKSYNTEDYADEAMTPMQRALAKVKAQSKDKVSVKKAPWDKGDAKKESVDIENVNEADQKQIKSWHPPSNAAGQRALAKGLTDYSKKIGKNHMDHKDFADHAKHVKAGAWDKVRTHANNQDTEVRDKIHSLAIKHLGLGDASELYGEHGDMSESYGGDRNEIENVNEVVDFDNLGDSLPYFIKQSKGAEADWYSNLNRTMKTLESDLKRRKDLHLGNARRYMDVKGHHEASLKAIADVRSKLKNVVKAFDKAFSEANAVDREIIRADKEAAKYKVKK